jgi:hypothetical protein
MATSEAFTAGLFIVGPFILMIIIAGLCWRRSLRKDSTRRALEAENEMLQGGENRTESGTQD